MAHTVIGFFRDSSDAYNAVDQLKTKGFDDSRVDVSSSYGNYENDDDYSKEKSGKVGNFFRNLFGGDDDNTSRYSEVARDNVMVTVHANDGDEAERAADILDEYGAIDVDEKGYSSTGTRYDESETSWSGDRVSDDYTTTGMTSERISDTDYSQVGMTTDSDYQRTDRITGDRDFDREKDTSIPIIEEQVNVGKREVKRGGVRIRSRIIERPVEETLRLREERVHVERTKVDRRATEADLENFREETIEINEYAEEPIVSKTARVVEEVRVGKEVEERNETVRDTERKTEVDVENLEKSHHHYDKD